MIRWISGDSRSGKTHLATAIQRTYPNVIVLDGWALRGVWTDLGWERADRWKHNMMLGRLAKVLERQGYEVVVTSVAPYPELREELKKEFGCEFTLMGEQTEDEPYEKPTPSQVDKILEGLP